MWLTNRWNDPRFIKVLGRSIGASGDRRDGDGDGFYTAVPGGEDNVPVPWTSPVDDAFTEWDDLAKIVDFRAFSDVAGEISSTSGTSDEDPDFELSVFDPAYAQVIDAWNRFVDCRMIRSSAYQLAGIKQASSVDPLGRLGDEDFDLPDGVLSPEERVGAAKLLMGLLALAMKEQGKPSTRPKTIKTSDPIYRAASGSSYFFNDVKEGAILDIPLLSWANQRRVGPNEFLATFGTDVLFVMEEGSLGLEGPNFTGVYTEEDENEFLDDLEQLLKDLKTDEKYYRAMRDGIDPDWEEIADFLSSEHEDLSSALNDYRLFDQVPGDFSGGLVEYSQKVIRLRERIRSALREAGLDRAMRFAGEPIDMTYDEDLFYAVLESESDNHSPKEIISGGRLEVVSIEDDPRGTYRKVVKLRQIGVFDPVNPGRVLSFDEYKKKVAALKTPRPFDLPQFNQPLNPMTEERRQFIEKAKRRKKAKKKTTIATNAKQSAKSLLLNHLAQKALNDTFVPPTGVQAEARRALEWMKEGEAGGGFTAVGRRRAAQLANGQPVSLRTIRRMASYLARHSVDSAGEGYRPGSPGYPSPGRVAWAAWGGDPAISWTNRVLRSARIQGGEKTANGELRSEVRRNRRRRRHQNWQKLVERGVTGIETLPDGGLVAAKADSRKARSDRLAATPAPPEDRILGSRRNAQDTAASVSAASEIEIDESTLNALRQKVKEHNSKPQNNKPSKKTSLSSLKAVYRRGAGAFSSSHRPGMTRNQWAMGRVNAFLVILEKGKPNNERYVNDNDLLPSEHPLSAKKSKK